MHFFSLRETQRYADIIIPHGGKNTVAISLLETHIRSQLHYRGRVSINSQACFVPPPDNLIEKDAVSISLIRDMMADEDHTRIKKILLDPFFELMRSHIAHAAELDPNVTVCRSNPDPMFRFELLNL